MSALVASFPLELITSLRPAIALVPRHDALLAKQFRSALASGRIRGDRVLCIALGSGCRLRGILDVRAAGWTRRPPLVTSS